MVFLFPDVLSKVFGAWGDSRCPFPALCWDLRKVVEVVPQFQMGPEFVNDPSVPLDGPAVSCVRILFKDCLICLRSLKLRDTSEAILKLNYATIFWTRLPAASLGATRNWQLGFQLLVQRWTPLSETLPCLGEVSESLLWSGSAGG